MTLREFQDLIETLYGERDRARGIDGNFRWFVEEVGELARAIRDQDRDSLEEEFADCLAWLTTLASLQGVDLGEVADRKYGSGCPRCRCSPCCC